MNTISIWQSALAQSWYEVWGSFLGVMPTILGAIVIFTVGLIIAYWVKRLVVEMSKLIRLDSLTVSTGIDKYLKRADFTKTLSEILGLIVEWIIILVFFLAAVDILGLSVVSQVLASVIGYIPNILAAALIFAAGYVVSGFVDSLVRGAITSVDKDIARPTGRLARGVLILISFFAAIDQLQIAQGLIATFFQGLTYTIVLIVGLSVGLGAKDLVSKVLADWYDKIKK